MKGLIYKDFLCLRKNLKTFGLVSFGMIIMGIMFLLSTQYGNVAKSFMEVEMQSEIDQQTLTGSLCVSTWFMLVLPICFMTDVAQCFREDHRVGFGKVLSGMALTDRQIVGSRYLTTLIYGGISVLVSLFCAFLITVVPVELELGNLFYGILTVASGFLLYMSLNLFLIYLFGARKANLLQILPLLVGFVLMGVMVNKCSGMTEAELNRQMLDAGDKLMGVLQNGYKVLIPAAVVGMLLSYAGSVAIVKRRRRVL